MITTSNIGHAGVNAIKKRSQIIISPRSVNKKSYILLEEYHINNNNAMSSDITMTCNIIGSIIVYIYLL